MTRPLTQEDREFAEQLLAKASQRPPTRTRTALTLALRMMLANAPTVH